MKKKTISEKLKKQIIDDAYLNIKVDPLTLFNPLKHTPDEFAENPHLYVTWLLQQPEYFSFICSEILNLQILPFQAVILEELWRRKFPCLIGSRGMSKSFLLSLYSLLRLTLLPARKMVIVGAAFRQSKILYNYMNTIYNGAPLYREIVNSISLNGGPHTSPDMCTFVVGDSIATMLPLGDGEKIRGQRAHDIIADELDSINQEILEKIVFGFGVVSADPIGNVKKAAAIDAAKELNIDLEFDENDGFKSNQIILSGTAGYSFKHFCNYWKKWKRIIHSRGEKKKIEEIFNGIPPEGFDWRDYSIMRIPFEKIPKGFMDAGVVAQARAAVHSGQYQMEYGAVFSDDTIGFFKRSLIESCTVSNSSHINLPSEKDIMFNPLLQGFPDKRYIFGIDTASERDNFAITVLEVHPDHSRIVYCWTTNKKDFNEDKKEKLTTSDNFYSYVIAKIKNLMKRFPCERIMIDSQGGGHMIVEGLHNKEMMGMAIWPVIVPGKPAITDGEAGLHLIELVSFADARWTSDANHGLKKDMEDKLLLFPYVDAGALGLSIELDLGKTSDRYEDCVFEIEELKNELTTIVHDMSPNGNRERWDTAEQKLSANKKERKRKDRYSALLMANMGARQMRLNPQMRFNPEIGGFIMESTKTKGRKYIGPAWLTERLEDLYS